VDPAVVSLSPAEQYKLKQQIIADQASANAVRFDYEIIDKPERIVFVEPGRLPRTPVKGSIQRKQVESVLEEEMRILYPGSEEAEDVASSQSRENRALALL
jgi:exosome complex RNA-binding protein Csl4